jgi:hypothetical protein
MERNIYRRERKIKQARKEGRQVYMLIPPLLGCPAFYRLGNACRVVQ